MIAELLEQRLHGCADNRENVASTNDLRVSGDSRTRHDFATSFSLNFWYPAPQSRSSQTPIYSCVVPAGTFGPVDPVALQGESKQERNHHDRITRL
jgi:hypothetical protein